MILVEAEIISVDSVQVYKHLNIGSGKPDKTVLKKYPHKLIDVIEPHESYSTGKFQTDCIKEIKKQLMHLTKPLF